MFFYSVFTTDYSITTILRLRLILYLFYPLPKVWGEETVVSSPLTFNGPVTKTSLYLDEEISPIIHGL